jgi:hypothetical protein
MARLLVLVALTVAAAPAAAADRKGPLEFVPASARIVVSVENPRKLADAVLTLDAVKQAEALAPVRTVLDSAAARRVFQMLAYSEKELGAKWPELLDQLAGDGVALGAQFGDKAPALLVLRGTDERQVEKAYALLFRVIGEEMARQGSNERPVREERAGLEAVRIGNDIHTARVGATVFVSNKAEALQAGIDLALKQGSGESVAGKTAAARKLLPKDPLAWVWVDFAAVKESKEAKDFFDATRQDFLQTLVVGSTIDCLKRSDFVAAGFYRESGGLRLTVRLPAGRDAFPPEFALHVPPAGTPGSLPLLEPPGVLYSQSFHLDIGAAWKHRDKLINDEVRKQIEEGEKQLSKFLPGPVKLGELLEMWGPYHRIVVADNDALPYKKQPSDRLPAFAYVAAMRDAKFGQSVESIVRGAAIIATLQLGLKSVEETHDGIKIVGYRFPEDRPLANDPGGLRFNFEPCFAVVGDQFVAASTIAMCKKTIAEVKRTAGKTGAAAVWRAGVYAAGAAAALASLPEPLITDAILEQGVGIEEARKQVNELAAWLRTLGTARVEIDERATEYRFDVMWEYKTDGTTKHTKDTKVNEDKK